MRFAAQAETNGGNVCWGMYPDPLKRRRDILVENKIPVAVEVFRNDEFWAIRAIVEDGETWFAAKDVCSVFGDTNHNRSVGRVDDTDKRAIEITDNMGRLQTPIFVNEPGLYSLLFTMQP